MLKLCLVQEPVVSAKIWNYKQEKDERRTSNAQHRTSNVGVASLRFLIKLKRRRRTIIQRWKFDVGCSFFNPVLGIEY